MTSGQISSGLDLTYAPPTITTQQLIEGELDLLFKVMYDGHIGGQPSATPRTVLAAQAPQEVIEFDDSYKAPLEETGKGPASESSTRKKGRTVAITAEDMRKRRNDVKARTTLLLALPDEHPLRFKTLEQTFNRLQAIMSHLEFMDVEIEQDDLNKKFLTSHATEWLMYTIVWRNKDDIDTMSLDDVYNHLKVYEPEVQKKSESNSQNMDFISSSNTSSGKGKVYTASVLIASTQVSTASTDVEAASLIHDTISDDEVLIEFALMAKSSSSSDNETRQKLLRITGKGIIKSGKHESFGHGGGKITGKGIIKSEYKNQVMNEFCTKKGIRREFNNARTPQQNGVAERKNKTLIEAARTMLADAKIPVNFWAEAVNTAYHLEKFDAKGDKGYFVGYSLSSKAFRVFNKRTKKVDENLYVDFLENKLIEKGASPNWLFDIDTLTNLMNYKPVVVAGTSSTNISGTKDVASKAMKKDVSSLRYIALPNWFHEAHMETSNDTIRNSDAQDDCNADVPKSSGISNPTATSKVPLADQVETAVSLPVESKILTVSSHVPTVCLDTSLKSSSSQRLISKGVFSQKETPSLGNALTLLNKFEDTFGDTTNAVTLNKVEADLSNMETSIPVSPTPTFRIHKDHPNSQIIS
nr:hypothetical protein [Tanacetum cinerariifolium]